MFLSKVVRMVIILFHKLHHLLRSSFVNLLSHSLHTLHLVIILQLGHLLPSGKGTLPSVSSVTSWCIQLIIVIDRCVLRFPVAKHDMTLVSRRHIFCSDGDVCLGGRWYHSRELLRMSFLICGGLGLRRLILSHVSGHFHNLLWILNIWNMWSGWIQIAGVYGIFLIEAKLTFDFFTSIRSQ